MESSILKITDLGFRSISVVGEILDSSPNVLHMKIILISLSPKACGGDTHYICSTVGVPTSRVWFWQKKLSDALGHDPRSVLVTQGHRENREKSMCIPKYKLNDCSLMYL